MFLFKKKLKLVTHDGAFHADDVFAYASLSLLLDKRGKNFELIRTRDPEIIKAGDFVFDVGGIYDPENNRFDHHQNGFVEKRANGITYSSFGLIWRKYGAEICGNEEVGKYIDEMLVEQVDATDNGMNVFSPATSHMANYDISSVVASFLPAWGEQESIKNFENAVALAKGILKKEIKQHFSILKVQAIVDKAYKEAKDKRLLVLEEEIPRYLIHVVSYAYPELLFVVFPNEKNWKVYAVRKQTGVFENKKNLPTTWAGLFEADLQKVTGVNDAVFCHRGLFMAIAHSREGAIKLAQIAVES